MILHYDTETTGIPINGVPSDDPRHPHIVSLSAVLDDDQGVTRRVMSVLVKPVGYKLEQFPEAQKIHGITSETAEKYGVPLYDAMAVFMEMVDRADTISAFNHHFDHKLSKIACSRLGDIGTSFRQVLESKSSICAMESAANFLTGKKRMSLKNAHFELFKEEIQTGYHGSLEDTMASRRIFYEIKKRGAVMERKSLAAKEYDTPYQAAV